MLPRRRRALAKLSPMRVFFYGISSFSYWMSVSDRPPLTSAVGAEALKHCVPHAQVIGYLQRLFPQIPQPYHVLVRDHRKSPVPQAVTHVSIFSYRERPFARIADGVVPSFALCSLPWRCLSMSWLKRETLCAEPSSSIRPLAMGLARAARLPPRSASRRSCDAIRDCAGRAPLDRR